MNRLPFVRLAEENFDTSPESSPSPLQNPPMSGVNCEHSEPDYRVKTNGNAHISSDAAAFPSAVTAGSRYRGPKEVDFNKWDEEASQHLINMPNPPGDLCDCLLPWRRTCGLRHLPSSHTMAENAENGFPLPFGVVWFVRDCAGVVCMIITWLLIAYGEFVVACVLMPQTPSLVLSWTFGVIYHIFAFLAVVSHLKAVFTDPGTVRLGNATRDAVMRIYVAFGSDSPLVRCPKCYSIKPERTHHCSCCRRCVRKMDHHCPWVNNCVGEGNQKYFVLFNLYICLQSITAIIMVGNFFFSCFSEFGTTCKNRLIPAFGATNGSTTNPMPSTMLVLGAGFESILFGLFTAAIGGSQLCAICKDETAVESLKRGKAPLKPHPSTRETLSNVFGQPFSWRWFSPFHPPAALTPVIPPLVSSSTDEEQMGSGVEGEFELRSQKFQQRRSDVYQV